MFKFSTRSKTMRKYYERRIRHFLDFIKFDLDNKHNVEKRCNAFAYRYRHHPCGDRIVLNLIDVLSSYFTSLNPSAAAPLNLSISEICMVSDTS